MADYRDVHVMKILCFAEEPPFFGIGVIDPFVGWDRARELNSVNLVAFVARGQYGERLAWLHARRNLHGDVFDVGAFLLDRDRIFQRERFAVSFLSSQAAAKSKIPAKNEQGVGPVLIEKAADVLVESDHDRGHSDNGHDSDYHAQHR